MLHRQVSAAGMVGPTFPTITYSVPLPPRPGGRGLWTNPQTPPATPLFPNKSIIIMFFRFIASPLVKEASHRFVSWQEIVSQAELLISLCTLPTCPMFLNATGYLSRVLPIDRIVRTLSECEAVAVPAIAPLVSSACLTPRRQTYRVYLTNPTSAAYL